MKIANREISYKQPPLIIAEIGINHGGNLITAKKMVDLAFTSGCEIIKHQTHFVADEMTNEVIVAKHNIDEEPNTPTKYGVRGIPTMLLFKDGELKSTKVGATPKSDIVSWIKENI